VYRLSSPVYEERLVVMGLAIVRVGGGIDSDEPRERGVRAWDMKSVVEGAKNCC
jgi:hypothetical protein